MKFISSIVLLVSAFFLRSSALEIKDDLSHLGFIVAQDMLFPGTTDKYNCYNVLVYWESLEMTPEKAAGFCKTLTVFGGESFLIKAPGTPGEFYGTNWLPFLTRIKPFDAVKGSEKMFWGIGISYYCFNFIDTDGKYAAYDYNGQVVPDVDQATPLPVMCLNGPFPCTPADHNSDIYPL